METRDMNGRSRHAKTGEERLASVARSLTMKMQQGLRDPEKLKNVPDYADFCDAFRPYVRREQIIACIAWAKKHSADVLTRDIQELAAELMECEKGMPPEDRL
jgi:hypothetical protein